MRSGIDVPLVGRDRELAAIRGCLRRAAAGTREAIVLEGEAGIGKTRLISECVTHATEIGLTVVHGVADESEQERPCGILLDAFGSTAPELAQRLGPQSGEVADRRLAIVDAVVSVLSDASRALPTALVLDDLHWSDTDTLRALRSLIRRTATIPFVLVAACRPATSNAELDALIEAVADVGTHIEVQPLDEADVSELVTSLAPDPPSPVTTARVRSARGNPFFVIELVASGVDDPDEIPKDLKRTILRRVMRLSEEARTTLRLGSLLGATIDADELATITGRTAADLLGPLDEALKAGVLEERDRSLAFRHDLVREAVYTDIPESVREKLHRDAARALAMSGAPARRIAAHLATIATHGDEEAISWLRRAAAEEKQRSPTLAADMLGRVVDLMDPADPAAELVDVERVQALNWAGRVSEAQAVATGVLSSLRDPSLATDVRVSLAESLFFAGRVLESAQLMQQAASDSSGAERGLRHSEAALGFLMSGQPQIADDLAANALAEVDSTSDLRALSQATAVRSAVCLARGMEVDLDRAREAVRIADDDFLGEAHRYAASTVVGYCLSEHDFPDEATDVLRRAIERLERQGISVALPGHYALLGAEHFLRGEWDDAVAELETVKALLDDMGSSLIAPAALALLANIALHRGDLDRAESELVHGEALLAQAGPQLGTEWLVNTRALLLEARGEAAGAFGLIKMACGLAQSAGVLLAFRYFAPTLVRLAMASGVPDESVFAVEAVESFAAGTGIRSASGVALMCRGMLEGDAAPALEAVEILRGSPRPLELATAHEQAGIVLAGAKDFERSAEQFQDAFAIYERLGAQLDVDRATEAVNTAGGRRKKARPRRPVTGWGSLSPTERKVASLVAEGLSNNAVAERLVVSRRTVETHVYHVFQKLMVSSRAELAARASRELGAAEVQ